MGAHSTHACVYKLTPPTSANVDEGHAGTHPPTAECVAEASDPLLGANLFDEALFDHFAADVHAKHGEAVLQQDHDPLCYLLLERIKF